MLLLESIIETAWRAGPAVLESGMSHIVASLCSALAYLSTDVRLDALAALLLAIKAAPAAFQSPQHSERLLRGVMDLVPSTRHSAAESRSFFGLFAPDDVCVGALAAGAALAAKHKSKGSRGPDMAPVAAVPAASDEHSQSQKKKARTAIDHRASASLRVRTSAAQARSWELLHSTVDLEAVLASADMASVSAHSHDHGGQTTRDSVPARVVMTPEDARVAACLVLEELLRVAAPGHSAGDSAHGVARALVAQVGANAVGGAAKSPPAELLLSALPTTAMLSGKSKVQRAGSGSMPAGATTGVHAESAAMVFTRDPL